MDREEVLKSMIATINNVNDRGLFLISALIGMEKIEEYNKGTTPERVAEIEEIKLHKEQEAREGHRIEEMREEIERRAKLIESLTGRARIFWNKIQSVDGMAGYSRYDMSGWQALLLANIYDNNLLEGGFAMFRYGFYQGVRYMKNRAAKGARTDKAKGR